MAQYYENLIQSCMMTGVRHTGLPDFSTARTRERKTKIIPHDPRHSVCTYLAVSTGRACGLRQLQAKNMELRVEKVSEQEHLGCVCNVSTPSSGFRLSRAIRQSLGSTLESKRKNASAKTTITEITTSLTCKTEYAL
jgi:hypothetical protein